MSIKNYIIENFKDCSLEEIEESIVASCETDEEDVLPGMGVLFTIVWEKSTDEEKNIMLKNIKESIEKY